MPRKIIIDTDPGVDDVVAIILALASPEVDLLLISIVFGNTHAPTAYGNLLKIYALLGREIDAFPEAKSRFPGLSRTPKTKLALGENDPIGGEKAVAAYFHGLDGLSNISDSHPEWTPPPLTKTSTHPYLEIDDRKSSEVILETLRQEPPDEVVIVALGPLTNIAHAYQSDPDVLSRAAGIVWMGGTMDHPGNVSPNAEFNCFADPYAASIVHEAIKSRKLKMVMAPLDVTTIHQVPFVDLIHPSIIRKSEESGARGPEKIMKTALDQDVHHSTSTAVEEKPPTPIQAFLGAMLLRVRALHQSFGIHDAMEQHDPLALWYALSLDSQGPVNQPGNNWRLKKREFQIERKGELTRGMCVIDRRKGGGNGSDDEGDGSGDRTLGELANGGVVKLKADHDLPKPAVKNGEKGRMGETIGHAHGRPDIIIGTPGVPVLRKLILERVFGQSAE